jgi:hypothetical protein
VGSSAATYYTQWDEIKVMPCVVVSSEGGSEVEDTIGIYMYTIVVSVLSEPNVSGSPETDHFTLVSDVLEYLYSTNMVTTLDTGMTNTTAGSFRIAKTHSTVDKGRVFKTDIDCEIAAKSTNF